ncbi:MAG: hypothetical protein ACO1SV_16090 [Fimbriimonas sp.]
MIALAALLLTPQPTFAEINAKMAMGAETPIGVLDEMRLKVGPDGGPSMTFNFRYSQRKEGAVVEGWRDGKRFYQVMTDGKTVAVIANQSSLVCRMPADPKFPLDIGTMRLRADGKRFKCTFPMGAGSDLLAYKWKGSGDRADFVDGVACRRLSYRGTHETQPDMDVDVWIRKDADIVEFMRIQSEGGAMTVDPVRTHQTIPLPGVSLAKAPFKGLTSAPLSMVREKAMTLWTGLAESEE